MSGLVKCLILVVVWTIADAAPGHAGNDLSGPRPDWVVDAPRPAASPRRLAEVSGGLYILVLDRQVRWRPDLQVSFRRVSYKITDRLGLEEGARMVWSYDPSHETVSIHRIDILRDGVLLPQLERTTIRTYRREKELDDGIVDGHLTVHADIADVRVGDVVEYELSFTSKPQIELDDFDDGFDVAWHSPVAYQRYRVWVPDDVDLQVRRFGIDEQPRTSSSGGMTLHEWVFEDREPVPSEDDQPPWHIQGGVLLSSAPSWAAVSRLLAPHYLTPHPLPEEFAAKVDEISQRFPDRQDRITETLRLVQDQIRYVGNEIGRGAYVPRTPQTTLGNGFGDCKDKAIVLISALARMGISSVPALVHLTKGHGIKNRLPGLSAFDHVIVQLQDGARTLWLDPTLSHQGGRVPDIPPPDYGYALPISHSGSELALIPSPAQNLADITVRDIITFPKSMQHVLFETVTTYAGAQADTFRWQTKNHSPAQLERNYFSFYERIYPGLEKAARLEISDDRDRNRITVRETYMLGGEALRRDNFGRTFPLKAYNVDVLKSIAVSGRTQPVKLDYPLNRIHEIKVVGLGSKYVGPAEATIDNGYLRFSLTSRSLRDGVRLRWELRTKDRVIQASDAADYAASVRKISDNLYWTYNFLSGGADESWTSEDVMAIAVLVMIAVPILAAAVLGWRFGLKADQDYRADAAFFPVAMSKFIVLNICTICFYSLFVMHKFWRWKREQEGARVWPAWRAVFSPVFLYLAFSDANRRLPGGRIPIWIGMVAFVWIWVAGVASWIPYQTDSVAELIGILIGWSSFLAFVPVLAAVNRLNGESSVALLANSCYNAWNITGIVLGGILILLVIWQTFVVVG